MAGFRRIPEVFNMLGQFDVLGIVWSIMCTA